MDIEDRDINSLHNDLVTTGNKLHELYFGRKRSDLLHKMDGIPYNSLEYLILLKEISLRLTNRVDRMLKDESVPFTHDFDLEKILSSVDLEDESVKGNITEFMNARAKLLIQLNTLESEEDWVKYKINHEKYGELNLKQLLTIMVNLEKEFTTNAKKNLEELDN